MSVSFYGDSSDDHLLALRKAYIDTLEELQLQAARFGGAVPIHIATGIKEAEANIRAIDDKRLSKISSETAAQLGDTGRFTVVTQRLDELSGQIRLTQRQSDESRGKIFELIGKIGERVQLLEAKFLTLEKRNLWVFAGLGLLQLIGIGILIWILATMRAHGL